MDRRRFLETTSVASLALAAGAPALTAPQEGRQMEYILFSKLLREQSIDELIESLKSIGADGVDFTVRPGYPVTPDNAPTDLKPAAERIRAAGLSIPLVTAPTDLRDAATPYVEPLFRACGAAGVPYLKLGYWPAPADDYWTAVEGMKADVKRFAEIGRRHGVKPCLHTHSGANLGLNAAALLHILRDFDPSEVGAYPDVGHLAVCGEPLPVAFAMLAPWLTVIGIKDMDRVRTPERKITTRQRIMGEGIVDWPEMMQWLVAHDFRGPLTLHAEFEAPTTEARLALARSEIAFLRALEASTRSA